MKIQSPPGMRDFYPDEMRLQNWLFDQWRGVSRSFGFEEYEGPIFEFLDLYTIKSGEGIVSELFNFEDRGGRRFAIRPEMTPTLARMVAARANALARPIKWFSIPRMCRAEKPQKGRLREFFQWNLDILGTEDFLSDAEVIAAGVELLRRVGLTPADATVRISSRPVTAGLLEHLGIAASEQEPAYGMIDRMEKLGEEEFGRRWNERYGGIVPAERLSAYLKALSEADFIAGVSGKVSDEVRDQVVGMRDRLRDLGVEEFCRFDATIVRGLAYYTGTVFEIHARKGGLRAIAGGGRYDNLTGLLDGPNVPGIGFGMGDAPLIELLRETGKLPALANEIDAFVIDADESLFPVVLEIVGGLRRWGLSADFSYKRGGVGKQMKQAAVRGARYAVIVGEEWKARRVVGLKDMKKQEQREVSVSELACRARELMS